MYIFVILALLLFIVPGRWSLRYFLALQSMGCVAVLVVSGCAIGGMDNSLADFLGLSLGVVEGFFGILVALTSLSVGVYTCGFLGRESVGRLSAAIHCFAQVVLLVGMAGVLGATLGEPYRFLFNWELMALSAFMLLLLESGRREVVHSAIRFLVIMHVSFFVLIMAFSLAGFAASEMGIWLWVLFFVGFGIKAGVMPFHGWMAPTYVHAAGHVAALSSGAMIAMGVYGVVKVSEAMDARYWFVMGVVMLVVGGISGLYGIFMALKQKDIRRMLAFSSTENMGIVFMSLGVAYIGRAQGLDGLWMAGMAGAVLHVLGHGAYKTVLFLGAGSMIDAMKGKADMNRMGGLARRMPVTAIGVAIAMLGICAIPGLCGFVSEFTIYSAFFRAITAGGPMAIYGISGLVVLALISSMTLMTFARAYGIMFLGQPRGCKARDAVQVNMWMTAGMIPSLVFVLVGGVSVFYFMVPLDSEMAVSMGLIYAVVGVTVVVVGGLWWLRYRLQRGRVIGMMPTWGCAFTALTPRVQYTASSMARELEDTISMSGDFNSTASDSVAAAELDLFPQTMQPFSRGDRRSGFAKRWVWLSSVTSSRYWNAVLRRYSSRFAMFQTGKTSHYILHALVLLVLVLMLSIFNIL